MPQDRSTQNAHEPYARGRLASRRAGGLRHETGVIGEITAKNMLAGNALGREPSGLEGGMSGGHDVQEDHAQRMTLMKKDLGKHRIALDETIVRHIQGDRQGFGDNQETDQRPVRRD